MRLVYPYNEILPKKRAHDIFVVHECVALSELGWDVTLLVGKGSKVSDLTTHYQLPAAPSLHIHPLFIVRKNNPLGISWNLPFFLGCQHFIKKHRPNYLFLSVWKQAAFHVMHKIPGTRYLFEVHELSHYPGQKIENSYKLRLEKMMLSRMDLVTVTTAALKEILLKPPYSLQTHIEVLPLAVRAQALPPPPSTPPLTLMYIGQLYPAQGLTSLLSALSDVEGVQLKVIGGNQQEIVHLSKLARELAVLDRLEFLGFIPPAHIPSIAQEAHAFVAPFEDVGRMPFVAHTKLFEYAEWGRPIIAPNLPIVREHFQDGQGTLLFEPGDRASLAGCIAALKQEALRTKLQEDSASYSGCFSWAGRAQAYKDLCTT